MYICYSMKKGKYDFEEISCHMEEWGIKVSDASNGSIDCLNEENLCELDEHIKNEKYVVIILSKALITDISILVELECIKKLFLANKIKVFTFVKEMLINELPNRLNWLKDTMLMQMDTVIHTHEAVYRLVWEYISDLVLLKKRNCLEKDKSYDTSRHGCNCSLWDELNYYGYCTDSYVIKLKKAYENVVEHDFETKITLLFALYSYLMCKTQRNYEMYDKCIENLFSYMGMCMPYNKIQLQIAQFCIVLMLEKNMSLVTEQVG